MSLEKNQVLSKQNELVAENKTLVSLIKNTKFEVGRRLEHFGPISTLASIKECVEALTYVNTKSLSSNEALKELDLDEETETLFLGYPIVAWKNDIKKRKAQIEASFKFEANTKAIELLEKHLSPDDIFARDMAKLEKELADKKPNLNKIANTLFVDEDGEEISEDEE